MTAQLVADALMMAIWRRGKPAALLHHSDQGSQGGFKWSSQHPGEECWDGGSASVRSCLAEQDVLTGTTSGGAAGAPAAFLGIDSGWLIERGRGDWRGCVSGGRRTVVSECGRHATSDACAIIEAVVWAIPVVMQSERSLPSSMPKERECGRSRGIWGDRDRRSRESSAVTLPRGAASWIIARAPRSGSRRR